MRPDRWRIYCPEGIAIHSGDVPAEGPVELECHTFSERIVFYSGDPDEEYVVGEKLLRRNGEICVDPEFPDPE